MSDPTYTNIEMALTALKAGSRIRRAAWDEERPDFFLPPEHPETFVGFCFTSDSIFAEDWFVVEQA